MDGRSAVSLHTIFRYAVAAILGATLTSQPAFAQSRSLDFKPLNDRRAPPQKTKGARKKACSEYGAGFYRLEGSDTCMRIGGGIDVTVGSGRR
jgi:hypothetical protein